MPTRSPLEVKFAQQIRFAGVEAPEEEYEFHDTRKWRLDFAWPDYRIAVEIEGGTYSGGRHTRGKGFDEDCVKYAAALLDGWQVLRVTGTHVKSGQAVRWLEQLLVSSDAAA